MKKIFYLLFFVALHMHAFATDVTKSKDKDFTINAQSTRESESTQISLSLNAKYESKTNSITIQYKEDATKKFTLYYPLDFGSFRIRFDSLFHKSNDGYLPTYQSSLEVFYWVVTINEEENTRPLAGRLNLHNYLVISNYSNKNHRTSLISNNDFYILINEIGKQETLSKEASKDSPEQKAADKEIYNLKQKLVTNGILKIDSVQLQFERGFLERIQVSVQKGNGEIEIFENSYPIGFSSIENYKRLSSIRLFPRNDLDPNNFQTCIYLSDVIQNYVNQLDNVTRDYSPADTAFCVSPNSNPRVHLYKQSSINIIDGKTFTDLNGFSEKSPNGLVQVELSRRFNINTHRIQFFKQINYGFFSYLHAQVNFSKIENKLKGLPLRNERVIENQTVISPSYATNLDFMRYENLSIRTDINLFLWDVPHYKLTYYVDFGLKYGHTPVLDSTFTVDNTNKITAIGRDLDAHSFTLYPRIWMELFAEKRYGLKLSYQTNFTRIFTNNNFKQVLSYSDKGADLASLSINPSARWSHTIEAFAFFDPNPKSRTGKIFALARFHFQHKDANTFYPQILLGYAFNIFN